MKLIKIKTQGGPRWINPDRIVMMRPDPEDPAQTTIVLANGCGLVITVQESCTEIVHKLRHPGWGDFD